MTSWLGSLHARSAPRPGPHGHPRTLARPVPEPTQDTTVADAIDLLRRHRASLAVVRDGAGTLTGMVTLDDLLARCLRPRSA